jgi:hypothetical protein
VGITDLPSLRDVCLDWDQPSLPANQHQATCGRAPLSFPNYLFGDACGYLRADRAASDGKQAMSILMEIVQAIGDDAAGKLVSDFAGTRLYVPQVPEAEDPIARSIGLLAAQKLARIYGGDRMDVPNPVSRRQRICTMRAAGCTIEAIARALHCTSRRVYQVLAEGRRALGPTG